MRSFASFASFLWLVLTCFVLVSDFSYAEDGVFDHKILIGQIAGFTGPSKEPVRELARGAQIYIDSVNQLGGVNGRLIDIVARDDRFDPLVAREQARILLTRERVFAFFLPRATPNTEAILSEARLAGVPIVGPSTGAAFFFEHPDPVLFMVRAKYKNEIAKLMQYFRTLGLKRFALINVNDTFGQDTAAGFLEVTQDFSESSKRVFTVDRLKPDIKKATGEIARFAPQAVIVACPEATARGAILDLSKSADIAQIAVLSNNANRSFAESLGPAGRGVVMTQVMPSPIRPTSKIGRELAAAAKSVGETPSYAMMEGYASAKVLVEGLRRAGAMPTRASFLAGLESLGTFDLGGIEVRYGRSRREGSNYVELSVIGPNGEFVK